METLLNAKQSRQLARMEQLYKKLEPQADSDTPEVGEMYAELRSLRAELVPQFLPLITRLVAAGLLTVHLSVEDTSEIHKFSSLDTTVTEAFDNGNIWLYADWDGCGTLRRRFC